MPNHVNSSLSQSNQPQYAELIRFLLTPLLDFPDQLRIDCELINNGQRVWIRLALDPQDQGKLLGRGGRNLSAIRTVLKSAGLAAQQSVYLDVYGEPENTGEARKTSKPTPRSEQPKKSLGREGKKKPQKRSKPTPNRSSQEVTPKHS